LIAPSWSGIGNFPYLLKRVAQIDQSRSFLAAGFVMRVSVFSESWPPELGWPRCLVIGIHNAIFIPSARRGRYVDAS